MMRNSHDAMERHAHPSHKNRERRKNWNAQMEAMRTREAAWRRPPGQQSERRKLELFSQFHGNGRTALALGLAACELLDLLLVGAARLGALGLRRSLLAGGALDLFTFDLVFNLFCICH